MSRDHAHTGGAVAPVARPQSANDLLRELIDTIKADRLLDTPSDGTDYRDYTLGAAADSLTIQTDTQFGYVYIPNSPRDLTIYAGARGQFLGQFVAGNSIQFRLPRATGLTIVYGAGSAAQSLTVVFSARPISVDVQGGGSSGFMGVARAEDSAHASGDMGVPLLGVRNNAFATLTSADGDYSPVAVTAMGAVGVAIVPTNVGDGAVMTVSTVGDLGGSSRFLGVAGMLFNGATLDRPRNNLEGTALASAARTATTQSSDITNHNARGVALWLDLTVVPGVQTVTLSVEAKDPVSGKYSTIFTGAAEVATATRFYEVYPGVAETANVDAAVALPRTFRVSVTHSGAGSFTYSVGYCLIN